jgi:hypothetical protein
MTNLSLVGGRFDNGRLPAGERDEPIQHAGIGCSLDRVGEARVARACGVLTLPASAGT